MNNKINSIIRRLSNKDIKEIKIAAKSKDFTSFPRLGADGRILPSQAKSWQVIQRNCLGFIKGDFENGELQLSELGKEISQSLI